MSTSFTNGTVQMAGRVSDHEKRIKTLERRSRPFANMQCIVYRSTNQSIASGGGVLISFDSVEYDPLGMFVIGTPTIVTLPVSGVWSLHGCVRWASTALAMGVRQAGLLANGVLIDAVRVPAIAGEATITGTSAIRFMASANTQISLQVRHTFGVNLDVEFMAGYSTYLELALQG